MNLAFHASCVKAGNERQFNEDRYCYDKSRARIALSDGASNGFESRIWAKVLAQEYVLSTNADAAFVCKATDKFIKKFDAETMSWATQGALDRGSYATLLGVAYDPGRKSLTVSAIGDSVFVLWEEGNAPLFYPTSDPATFSSNPTLLSSRRDANVGVYADGGLIPTTTYLIEYPSRTNALLLTDALAYWLLTNPDHHLPILMNLRSRNDYDNFVCEKRNYRQLRNDDTTLLKLNFYGPAVTA